MLDTLSAYLAAPTFPQFILTTVFAALGFVAMLSSPMLIIPYGLSHLVIDIVYFCRIQHLVNLTPGPTLRPVAFRSFWLALYVVVFFAQSTVCFWVLKQCWEWFALIWGLGLESTDMANHIQIALMLATALLISFLASAAGGVVLSLTVMGGRAIWESRNKRGERGSDGSSDRSGGGHGNGKGGIKD